jgi:hypothetical protein
MAAAQPNAAAAAIMVVAKRIFHEFVPLWSFDSVMLSDKNQIRSPHVKRWGFRTGLSSYREHPCVSFSAQSDSFLTSFKENAPYRSPGRAYWPSGEGFLLL